MSNDELLKIVETLAYVTGYVIGPGGTLYDRKTGMLIDTRTDSEKLRDAIKAGDVEALHALLRIEGAPATDEGARSDDAAK